jgi:hypothetical protein
MNQQGRKPGLPDGGESFPKLYLLLASPHSDFMLGLFFYLVVGVDVFLRNVG